MVVGGAGSCVGALTALVGCCKGRIVATCTQSSVVKPPTSGLSDGRGTCFNKCALYIEGRGGVGGVCVSD